jgi:hypothetical protein
VALIVLALRIAFEIGPHDALPVRSDSSKLNACQSRIQAMKDVLYILPQYVTAPKGQWTLHRVLVKGKAGEPAYALGIWNGKRCIGARWNGTHGNKVGWPRIYTNPCWHVLDDKLCEGVIALLPTYADKILAMRFLNGEDA